MTISSRDIAITGAITIIIAIIIIALFAIISSQKQGKDQDKKTQELIDQIKKQGLDDQGVPISEKTGQEQEFEEKQETYTGRLINHSTGEYIDLQTNNAAEIRIWIQDDTEILINGKASEEQNLSLGDILSIEAALKRDKKIYALKIIIARSTSPTIPTNVSKPAIQPPAVDSRPVSPY